MARPVRHCSLALALLVALAIPGSAGAEDPAYAALLDAARAELLHGGYTAAGALLDRAEIASTRSAGPLRNEDVARLPFYRGVVEWYAGNRDEASLHHWRAAAVISPDLEPDPQLMPDAQARDVYYALRSDVRSGDHVATALPDDAVILIDGRRGDAVDTIPLGRHLVQVRCPASTFAAAWHTYGAPPADYLTLCGGGSYTVANTTSPPAVDPGDLLCPAMTPAELDAQIARGRAALFADDIAEVVAVDAELQKRLPCLRGSLVEPERWAPHLITLAIAAYARNLDWQTPLASALAAAPNVPRAVGAGHPIAVWTAPAPVPATRAAPVDVEVYVDGRRVSYLPHLTGPHLVQLRDGGQFRTHYLPNGDQDASWDDLLAPLVQASPPSTSTTTSVGPARRWGGAKVGMVLGGAVVAAGGGGLIGWAGTQEHALLADDDQLRQWALAGETATTVEGDPAVKRVNTLYLSGYVTAGTGLVLGALGFALPVHVVSVDGAQGLVYSRAW